MEKGSFRLAMRVPGGWKVYESFSSEAEIDRKLARLAHRPEVEYVAHGPSWVGARYRLTAAARRAVESLAQLAPAPPGLPETS